MTQVQTTRQCALHKKLLIEGAPNLSDTELLAIFLGFNHRGPPSLHLALQLTQRLGDLRSLLNTTAKHFQQIFRGGEQYYVQFQAAKEICLRSDFLGLQKETQLTNSQQTYTYLKKRLRDYKNETFAALFLDNQHRIIAYEELFSGTINSATIHPRPLVERVLQLNAAAVILAHNHPLGVCQASHQDIAITERLRDALDLIDTRLLDHIVIGDNEVYSIVAENLWACH